MKLIHYLRRIHLTFSYGDRGDQTCLTLSERDFIELGEPEALIVTIDSVPATSKE